jgi:sec-independent protein translocase protein TatA
MQGLGLPHILILLVILLIFFGPSRLPALGQSIGKAIKGFKEGLNEIDAESKDVGPQKQINNQNTASSQNSEDKVNQNKG